MKTKLKVIISWFLVLLWMLVIFSFSHMNGDNSNSKSKGTINKILETTNKVGITNIDITAGKEAEAVDKLNGPLRKLMHMGVYFILALLVINALRVSDVKSPYKQTVRSSLRSYPETVIRPFSSRPLITIPLG